MHASNLVISRPVPVAFPDVERFIFAAHRLAGLSGAMQLAETQPEKKARTERPLPWPPN